MTGPAADKRGRARLFVFVVGLALVSLVAAACEAEMEIKIDSDGSGTAAATLLMDKSLASALDEDALADLESELPDAKIETVSRGDMKGVAVTQEFDDLEALVALLESGAAAGGGLDGAAEASTDAEVSREGDVTRLTIRETMDAAAAAMIDVRYVITLPSRPLEHNADKVQGNTMTWSVKPGENEIFVEWRSTGGEGAERAGGGTDTARQEGSAAATGDSGGGSSWVLPLAAGLGGGLGLLALVAVGYYAFLRRPRVAAPQRTSTFCTHCGAPAQPGARFCLRCGGPLA